MKRISELQWKLHEAEMRLAMREGLQLSRPLEGHREAEDSVPSRLLTAQSSCSRNPERQPTTPIRKSYSPPSAQPHIPSSSPGVEESGNSDCESLGFQGVNLDSPSTDLIDPSTNPKTPDNSSKDSRPQADGFRDDPLPPDDIPMERIPYIGGAERETRRAPVPIVRRNLTPEEIARTVSHEPPFEVPADWPLDRYERPIFYTTKKGSQWTFKLWTDLAASEKLSYRVGCPSPRNRIEIIRQCKMVTTLLLELTRSSLDFPIRHYEENNLMECHFRPMAQMIYPRLKILWGWNKQLTIDVMSSIANDNYHNNQQSKRKYANSLKNTKTLVRAPVGSSPSPSLAKQPLPARPPATKPSVSQVVVTQQVPKDRKGVGKGIDAAMADQLQIIDDLSEYNTKRKRGVPPFHTEETDGGSSGGTATNNGKHQFADIQDAIQGTPESEADVQVQYKSQDSIPAVSASLRIQVLDGEDFNINPSDGYAGFLKLAAVSMGVRGAQSMWYKKNRQANWAPLFYEGEWDMFVKSASEGSVTIKPETGEEWINDLDDDGRVEEES
ncbi:hypothetical protein DFP73DRAFT_601578 [Morchella snyderi]|nr:hypothetical protein DFP73DRAFT_601578 [Morchella snyderi]